MLLCSKDGINLLKEPSISAYQNTLLESTNYSLGYLTSEIIMESHCHSREVLFWRVSLGPMWDKSQLLVYTRKLSVILSEVVGVIR